MVSNSPSEFHFYVRCAKPLILHLLDVSDRALAAAWLRRLLTEENEELKTVLIKRLLFTLQKRKLCGLFKQHPNSVSTLEDFPERDFACAQNLADNNNSIPFKTDVSSDFCEYVAYQDVDNFGVHCYYAISNEPVTTWDQFTKNILPEEVQPKRMENVECKCFFDECHADPEPGAATKRMERKKEAERKRKKAKCGRQIAQTMVPLGKEAAVDKELAPPTWGSNLIKVKETFNQ